MIPPPRQLFEVLKMVWHLLWYTTAPVAGPAHEVPCCGAALSRTLTFCAHTFSPLPADFPFLQRNALPSTTTKGNGSQSAALDRGKSFFRLGMRVDVHKCARAPVYTRTHCVFHNYTYKQTNIDPGKLKMAAVDHYWTLDSKCLLWQASPTRVCEIVFILYQSHMCVISSGKWHNHSKSSRNYFHFWYYFSQYF